MTWMNNLNNQQAASSPETRLNSPAWVDPLGLPFPIVLDAVTPSLKKKSGFSLAELLVVIVIMSVLAGVAMPAFNAMMGGTGVQAASQDVKAMISQARQYAVMNNVVTHFVIASSVSLPDGDKDKWMRAYNIYDTTKGAAKKGEFVKSWKYLPEGLVFDQRGTHFKTNGGDPSNLILLDNNPDYEHDFGASLIQGNHWIQFDPAGRAHWETSGSQSSFDLGSASIALAEGFTLPANSEYTLYKNPLPADSSVAAVKVFRNTGRATSEIRK